MWRIDLVSPNKNHKISENTWYLKTHVNTKRAHTPDTSPTKFKFTWKLFLHKSMMCHAII